METNTPQTSPRDIFLHLLTMITLYVSAVSFTVLIFQYINVLIPDPLDSGGSYTLQSAHSTIRWSIASLVVIFPVYIFSNWYLSKNYQLTPERRNLRIRKWLIYFTLFAAALIIIGDLVALIFNLLGGEFTARFLLKILTIFFVAGSVFYYYLWDLKRHNIE
jgi:heme A synthase